ncbi:MAG: hypothetical protein K8T91_05260 [Planctomycetes bacterium]|nr:hypothetical protein [Planctomycetota bacterium]
MRHSLRNPVLIFITVGLTCALSPSCATKDFNTHQLTPMMQNPAIADNEVSLLMEASTRLYRPADAPGEATNIRGYLVRVRLQAKDDASQATEIVGPLWSIQGPISSMPNDTGIAFSQQDRKNLSEKPQIFLSSTGQLVKVTGTENENEFRRYLLMLEGDRAHWADDGLKRWPPTLHWTSPEYLKSNSGRLVVQREKDGKVRVYDGEPGKSLDDPWLQAAFKDLLQRDLGNVAKILTDDGRYIAVFPIPDLKKPTTFAIGHKSYSRETHGLLYERPTISPKLFVGLREDRGPFEPISHFGNVTFLQFSDDRLVLWNIHNEIEVSQQIKERLDWLRDFGVRVTDDTVRHRIIFTLLPKAVNNSDSEAEKQKFGSLHLLIWYYDKKEYEEHKINLLDMFELRDNGYYPKRAISVK